MNMFETSTDDSSFTVTYLLEQMNMRDLSDYLCYSTELVT